MGAGCSHCYMEAIQMIPISVQTGGAKDIFGIDGAYRAIREAGFDGVEVNLGHLLHPNQIRQQIRVSMFEGDDDRELFAHLAPFREAAEKYGLQHFQMHCPFPTTVAEGGEYNEYLIRMIQKTIRGCAYIGCHKLIVHPFYHFYDHLMTPEEEWQLNLENYARIIPAAREYHVTICLENMFISYRGKTYTACCSDMDIACRYIDTLNEMAGEKIFGFCLDTGHLLLLGKDIRQAICRLGDRLLALHVHDNDGRGDRHLAPYMGILDWNRFVEGLKEIGYRHPISFETYNALQVFDPELAPDVLSLIAKTGRMFARRIENR